MQSVHSVLAPVTEISPERLARLINFSLDDLQKQNEAIYGEQNRRNFSEPWRIIFRMQSYLGMVHKAVRKIQPMGLSHHICMGLSWSLAFCNNMGIVLETEAWKRFPGICPYCGMLPCNRDCHVRERSAQRIVTSDDHDHAPRPFREFQTMLSRIYPNNVALASAGHMLEELAEVAQATDHWTGRHENELFERIVTEQVDVITHICAVASCKRLDLAEVMAKRFGNGCPRCHHPKCKCEFTIDVAPPIR